MDQNNFSHPVELDRPKASERLANIMGKRNRRRRLWEAMMQVSSQSLVTIGETLALVAIFGLNFSLLLPYAGKEDMVSVFSAPLIPALAALTSFLFRTEIGVRFWVLVLLLGLPFTYYFMIREITGRKLTAVLSTIVLSLPTGLFFGSRINMAIFGSDSAAVGSLSITILASVFMLRFFRQGSISMATLSSIGIALVALISPFGLLIAFCFMVALTFSEVLIGQGRLKLVRLGLVMAVAAGFCAFWYHPRFVWAMIQSEAGGAIIKTLGNLLPISFFMLPVFGVLGYLLFENRPQLQPLSLAVFLTAGFGSLTWGGFHNLTMPARFIPVLGAAVGFLAGVVLTGIFDFIDQNARLDQYRLIRQYRKTLSVGLISVFMVVCMITVKISSDMSRLKEARVLGFHDVPRIGFWVLREKQGGISQFMGIAATLATTGMSIAAGRKLSKKPTAL